MAHSPYKSLVKAIRDDDYKSWERHVRAWESKQKAPITVPVREAVGKAVYDAVLHHAVANLQFEEGEMAELQRVREYFNLTTDTVNGIKRGYAPKALKMLTEWFLTDGILTGSERAQLLQFGSQMAFTQAEVLSIVKSLRPETAG